MQREEQLRVIRDSLHTSDVTCNPAVFDPPEWALRAVQRAYKLGYDEGVNWQRHLGAGLYPEGG